MDWGIDSESNAREERQTALKDRGIDTMLEEARESNRENDAEHMRRGG